MYGKTTLLEIINLKKYGFLTKKKCEIRLGPIRITFITEF